MPSLSCKGIEQRDREEADFVGFLLPYPASGASDERRAGPADRLASMRDRIRLRLERLAKRPVVLSALLAA